MRSVSISDITISRSGSQEGFTLSFREKLELAKLLDKAGVSVIEAGSIQNRKIDSLLIKSLATAVKDSTLAVPVTLLEEESVQITWNALSEARHPRLQVQAPVSTVQMEYICHKKPAALLETVKKMVSLCREKCPNVELMALDASRSEPEFLKEVIIAAAEAGAGLVTVCDSAGTMLPDEFYKAVKGIKDTLPEGVSLGVQCSNELYMADSCAMAAILAGADEVKTAAWGESTASLYKLTHILRMKGPDCGAGCSVRVNELGRTVSQIRWMCETQRSKASPFDNGVQEARGDVELTASDDVTAVTKAAAKLGYELSEEDIPKVYEAFSRIAAKKGTVGARELDSIVASAALQVPPTYRMESYVINSGNIITATCHMKMKKGEQTMESVCVGDGPVDAAFLAIEQIVGRHYELDDFQVQAVTEGREAMGETVVRLISGGKIYSGRGTSTDIVGSSILAYLSAANKIAYEEGEA